MGLLETDGRRKGMIVNCAARRDTNCFLGKLIRFTMMACMLTPRHALPAGVFSHRQVSDLHEFERDQMADIRPPSADITQYVVRGMP